MLLVSAASVRDAQPEQAAHAMRMACSAAAALGREHAPRRDFLRSFGPVTVALKRAENAAIADKPDVVLSLARKIPSGGYARPATTAIATCWAWPTHTLACVSTARPWRCCTASRRCLLSGFHSSGTPKTSRSGSSASGGP